MATADMRHSLTEADAIDPHPKACLPDFLLPASLTSLSGQEFKTTLVNMLQSLIEKVDTMHEQIGNVNREMETLRNDQKETLEILKRKRKKWRMPLMDRAEEGIRELENTLIETSHTEKKKRMNKKNPRTE